MGDAFTKKGLDSPRLMSELLMSHVLGCDRLRLYMDTDRPASPLERQTLRDLVARALRHEPVQYLVGEAWFFGLPFHVDPRVLIPRPATETIVQEVLQHHRATHGGANAQGDGVLIADVCTGSGCVSVAVLKNLKGARAVASDISDEALALARINAARHNVQDRVEFVRGDMLTPLRDHPPTRGDAAVDYLLSNPPYIPDDEWRAVEPNVKEHEPHLALRGGVDGLDFVRILASDGPALVRPGGMVLVEVADARAFQARELFEQNEVLEDVRVLRDFEGLHRVVAALRK
jgi:release factor glutamine methyltransferase